MNREELIKRFRELKGAAGQKLAEASEAIEAGNVEKATELQGEHDEYMSEAKVIKAQIEKLDENDGLDVEDEPPAQKNGGSKAARLPFNTDEEDEDEEPTAAKSSSLEDPKYILRYGDIDNAVKAVIKDMYGADYNEKRHEQMQVFQKFVRYGQHSLSADEVRLSRELIVTPDTLRFDLKAGMGVGGPDGLKATLQESVGELGGFLVPEDLRSEIIKRTMGRAIVRGRARTVTTTRNVVEWPRIEGGDSRYTSAVRVTHINEVPSNASVAETNPTFGFVNIPVNTVMARTDLSQNQLEDSAFNLIDILADLYAEAFALDENEDFLTGAGGNHARGILANRNGAEYAPEDGVVSVNSGNASGLTADGLIDLVYDLDDQYAGDAIMVAAKATYRDIRKLKGQDNDYLWERGLGEARMEVLGVPALQDEAMPAVAANAYPIIYGNFRVGYVIVDRVGMSVRRVEDTTTAGQNTIALFGRKRFGGAVVAPWAFRVQKVAS